MKEFLSKLDRSTLEEWRTRLMVAFFIALFCWIGGALLGLLLPHSWLMKAISVLGKIVFWIGLIGYLVTGVICFFVKGSRKSFRDLSDDDIDSILDGDDY